MSEEDLFWWKFIPPPRDVFEKWYYYTYVIAPRNERRHNTIIDCYFATYYD